MRYSAYPRHLVSNAILQLVILASFTFAGATEISPINLNRAQSKVDPVRKAVIMKSGASAAVIITAVRNVEDDAWWEHLEVEVKNVSTRPVYHLEVDLSLPDVVNDGRSLVIPLTYGRRDLMRNASRATSDDTPIKAGEIYTFKIPKRYWGPQDQLAAARRLGLQVYSVSFGDGTGFKAGGIAFSS